MSERNSDRLATWLEAGPAEHLEDLLAYVVNEVFASVGLRGME